jgi:hypothetical protein
VQKLWFPAVTIFLCLHAAAPGTIESLMDSGHWKRARTLVDARLRANPNDAIALYLASKVAASFRRPRERG